MGSGRDLRRPLRRGTSVALRKLDRDIKAASAHSARAGRAFRTSDVTTMTAETKEWLVEVVLVLLTAITLICTHRPPVEHADPNDAPPASVNSNG
jgi:hypothetical protein